MKEISGRVAFRNAHDPYSRWIAGAHATVKQERFILGKDRMREEVLIPSIRPKFPLDRSRGIFAIGSCFARHIELYLHTRGFRVASYAEEDFAEFELGLASAHHRDGTIKYNVFSMCNELRWALDPQTPFDERGIIAISDARHYDPHGVTGIFRTRDPEQISAIRRILGRVFARITECGVVIVTLGLTEAWYDHQLELYLNVTPPLEVVLREPDRFSFRITDYGQNLAALEEFYGMVKHWCQPDVKIIVSVSPVPLQATFSARDIVLATCAAKSTLRAVAEEWANLHDDVDYYPSYEMVIYSNKQKVFEEDGIHINRELVAQVTELFLGSYYPSV